MSCDAILDISATTIRDGDQIKIKINYKNNIIVGPDDIFYLDRWEIFGGSIENLEEIFITGVIPYYMSEEIWMDEFVVHMADAIDITSEGEDGEEGEEGQVNFKRTNITDVIKQGLEYIVDRNISPEAVYVYRFVYFVGGEWCVTDILMTSIQTPINSYNGQDYEEYTPFYPAGLNGIGLMASLDGSLIRGKRPYHVTRWNHRNRGTIESGKMNAWQREGIKHIRLINNIQRACEYILDSSYERISTLSIEDVKNIL